MPRKTSMQEKSLAEFSKMEENLKRILQNNDSKFAFTLDAWSAKNFKSYYGITIHFIDFDWKLQSIALDLIASEGKHKAKLFFEAVRFFEVDARIQGITVDNAAANTTFMKKLSVLMKNEGIEFDGDNQHFRCFA